MRCTMCPGRWPARGRPRTPERAEVQPEVRDARLQRPGKPRPRRHVADHLCADEADRRRRGTDRRAREESGELRPEQATGPRPAMACEETIMARTYRLTPATRLINRLSA